MNRQIIVFSFLLLFIAGLVSCSSDDVDQDELLQAEQLIQGLNMLGIMTDQAAEGGNRSGPHIMAPPLGWEGPFVFDMPEGDDSLYYRFFLKFPLDSMGMTIDSVLFLIMFNPDVWDSLYQDSTPTGMDAWLMGETRTLIYFHNIITIPDTLHVLGSMKWNWEETFYNYDFDVSTITKWAEIDIATSSNIGLTAQFRFDDDGAGFTEDNWGAWHNTIFVRFEFFAEPDANGYDGYYTLLSEAWKVRHYFVLIDDGEA